MKLVKILTQTKRLPGRRLGAAALVAAMLLGMATVASAATTVVDPDNLDGWKVVNGTTTAVGRFVEGPATPPQGEGSFRQLVGANGDDVQRLETTVANGHPLADFQLSYATYVTANNNVQATYVQVRVNWDADQEAEDTLAFEPAYQNGTYPGSAVPNQCGTNSGCVTKGIWQDWDASAGGWWSATDNDTNGPPLVTLDDYLIAHPGATLISGPTAAISFTAGPGGLAWQNFDGSIDSVVINDEAYNLEVSAEVIDCSTEVDDIAAIQNAVNVALDGTVIKLIGTCNFSAAPAHGGDITSVASTAVLIRPGADPIDGLTITSDGAPQSATILGSGTQAAFTVGPDNDNVTISGLRFVNVARAVVAINTDHTIVGDPTPETVPDPDANRIVGGATMDSAILGLAVERGPAVSSPSGTITVNYGATGSSLSHAFTGQGSGTLTNFAARGNYISYDPPGVPNGTTDVVAVDVRQRYERIVDGVLITHNAVGMFSSEFHSINQNGVKVHSLTPKTASNPPASSDYFIRNVRIEVNNLGRLEELDNLPTGDVNAGDIHASGRLGIQVIGASDFSISGNGVRTRMSSTGAVPMPGGGIVTSDSGFGRIEDNGIIVLTDSSTLDSDLGAIGVVDELTTLFGDSSKGQPSTHVVVRNNIVGPVGSDTPELGAQRGLVLNGSSDVAVDGNTFKFTSDKAINIAALVKGPGAPPNTTPIELPRTVTESTVCNNYLDSTTTKDNAAEVTFGPHAASVGNYFPGGAGGNAGCAAAPAHRSTVPANGARVMPADAPSATSTYNRDLNLAASSFVLRDKTASPVAGSTALSGPSSVSGGKRSISFTPAEALTELASPYTATVQAAATGGGTTTTTFSFTIDSTALPPVLTAPVDGSLHSGPITIGGTATEAGEILVFDGAQQIATTSVAMTTPATGTWSTTVDLNDGAHVLTAKLRDVAGNVSGASNARTVIVDEQAPQAPTIVASPSPVNIAGGTVVTVSGTAEAGSDVDVAIDDESNSDTAAVTGSGVTGSDPSTYSVGTLNVAALDDGTLTVTVTSTDAAGNQTTATAPLAKDTAIPASPSVEIAPDSINSVTQDAVTVQGSAEPNASIAIVVEGGSVEAGTYQKHEATTTANDLGAYAHTFDATAFPDGLMTASVKQTDAAGNQSLPGTGTAQKTAQTAPSVVSTDPGDHGLKEPVSTVGATYSEDVQNGTLEVRSAANSLIAGTVTTSGRTVTFTPLGGSLPATGSPFTAKTIATDLDGDSSSLHTWTFRVGAIPAGTITLVDGDGYTNAAEASGESVDADWAGPSDPAVVSARIWFSDAAGNIPTACGPLTVEPSGNGFLTSSCAGNLPQGQYFFKGVWLDADGHESAIASDSSILDTTVPAKPVISTPGSTVNTASVQISGTTDAGALVTVRKDGAVLGTATANGSGAWSMTRTFEDGTYTIEATAADPAGNVSAAESRTFTVSSDTTPPNVPVISAPAEGAFLENPVTISGYSDANSTIVVQETGAPDKTTTATPSGTWSLTATFSEGAHTINAIAKDTAGNASTPSASRTFTVDDTPPEAPPVILTPADGAKLSDPSVTLSGTTEPRAVVTIHENGSSIAITSANAAGEWSVVRTFTQGSHTITATATDRAGNSSAPSAGRSFSVDASAPNAPVITSPTDNATVGSPTTIAGNAEPGTEVTVREGEADLSTDVADVDGSWSVSVTLAEGSHTAGATATDGAGNESPASTITFTIDTTAPAAPVITTPADGAISVTAAVTVSGTTEQGATVTVRREDDTVIGSATAAPDGSWSLETTPLADGEHTITATATDVAGNESIRSDERTFTVEPDLVAPGAPVILSPEAGSLNGPSVAISGTAEPSATVEVFAGEESKGTTTAGTDGAWSLASTFPTGEHAITAKAKDAAGNQSDASEGVTFEVDADDPEVAITTATNATFGPVDAVTINGTASDAGTVTVEVLFTDLAGNETAVPAAFNPDGTWTASTSALLPGQYTVIARATDGVGNDKDSASITIITAGVPTAIPSTIPTALPSPTLMPAL